MHLFSGDLLFFKLLKKPSSSFFLQDYSQKFGLPSIRIEKFAKCETGAQSL